VIQKLGDTDIKCGNTDLDDITPGRSPTRQWQLGNYTAL